jgi:hypothetical protein
VLEVFIVRFDSLRSGISIPFCFIFSNSLSLLVIASASDPVRRLFRTLLALKPE